MPVCNTILSKAKSILFARTSFKPVVGGRKKIIDIFTNCFKIETEDDLKEWSLTDCLFPVYIYLGGKVFDGVRYYKCYVFCCQFFIAFKIEGYHRLRKNT